RDPLVAARVPGTRGSRRRTTHHRVRHWRRFRFWLDPMHRASARRDPNDKRRFGHGAAGRCGPEFLFVGAGPAGHCRIHIHRHPDTAVEGLSPPWPNTATRRGRSVAGMGVAMLTGEMTRFSYWLLDTFPILGRLG